MRSSASTRSMRCWERIEDFGRLRGVGFGSGELGDELLEALGGASVWASISFLASGDGFGEAGLVERL